MSKLTFKKSYWWALAPLLLAVGVSVKFALAITPFTPSSSPVGFVAQDEMTNYDLRSGNETLFRVQYEKEFWGGNLIAYKVNSAGDIASATQPWNGGAAYQIEVQGASRRIVTMKSDGTKIPFAWASLSTAQQGNLTGSDVLDYLRGDRSGEIQQGGAFRQRASALGDIIHSRPFYVSDATNPTVFVGANDGMLHAFDSSTGTERWAYVPSMLIPKMASLSTNPYVHDYFVDGTINVGTILSGSKRVLVGLLGAGGKGLYALNITGSTRLAPADEAAAATNILWEITPTSINNVASAAYANLGYTYGVSSMFKVGGVDAVIIGNGYNNGGDYQAYLFVINANTGALISAIKAGTSGSAASPNGLSTPTVIDSDGDGNADTVYAGDLNGTMWKFNLGASSATALLVTSPAQPITMTPGVASHPGGGFMVNFATGAMLADADTTDTSVFAAYGIWDGAPSVNTALLTQTLAETCYTSGTAAATTPCPARVRTVTANQPDWTAGATHHKGWRVPLPAGEKVVGDGSFIENGRFYFTGYNPTISTTVTPSSTVKGENWLMELDYLSGGVKNLPFLDLSGDHLLDNNDRVKDSASPRAPILTTDGVAVGKFLKIGVMSQPILVQLSSLNNTLFNQNPDVIVTSTVLQGGAGVVGGHFDVDIFYAPPSGGAQATATITVGTGGQSSGYPATLGAISVGGVVIVPAMTTSDLPNGTAATTNATTIAGKITGGFTATRSGSVITIKAPMGAQFNGQTINIAAGSSMTLVPAVAAVTTVTAVTGVRPTTGTLVITGATKGKNVSIQCGATYVGSTGQFAVGNSNTLATRLDVVYSNINNSVNGYATSCTKNLTSGATSSLTCKIVAPVGASACSGGFTLDSDLSASTNAGPIGGVTAVAFVAGVTGVPQSGWTNFAPALTATTFSNGGVEPLSNGETCDGSNGKECAYDRHIHQYDDTYDVTGVNMLNPSDSNVNIVRAIPSLQQKFKVIVHNQYLSPAVRLHIGNPSYLPDVDFGYTSLKNYTSSPTLDLSTLQTYKRDPNAVWPGAAVTPAQMAAQAKPIGSLVFNMPLDALTPKNWWGNGDVRVGLHPTIPQCMWKSAGVNDGNMYQPVNPPVNGVDGPGTKGWSSSTPITTQTSATGARHNGALTIQIIRDTTPNTAIELNVAGRPEYGWRVKAADYTAYVLAEYSTYWHHPNGKCYNSAGWTKTPDADTGGSTLAAKAAGSTDPKLGDLSAGSAGGGSGGSGSGGGVSVTSVTVTTVGAVTTTVITYADGTSATIVRTANSDGTVTIVTTDALGNVTTQTIANKDGSLLSGGDERGLQARTGRVSWRELIKP